MPLWSYLSGRGRCPHCVGRLPRRALLLPLAMAALLALVALIGVSVIETALNALFGSILLLLAATDLERRLIPNRIVYPAAALALALSWAWPDRGPLSALAGGGLLLLVTALFYVVTRGGFGPGDVKMAALIGLMAGLSRALAGLAIGILAGGLVAVLLLATGRVRRGDYIPYGPFLALGGIIALLWGDQLFSR